MMISRYALLIAYDGTNFSGWQKQPDTETVQGEIERVLSVLFQKEITIMGSGRTDAGVHALGQVAHVDLPDDHQAQNNLVRRLNSLLPDSIHIKGVQPVSDEFHARFDADCRSYVYRISNVVNPLLRNTIWTPFEGFELAKLQTLADEIKGEMDFVNFCKKKQELDHTRSIIYESKWVQQGDIIEYHITAKRFLHNMVRLLVGTMIKTAMGKISSEDFSGLLNAQETTVQPFRAPSRGLILTKVSYKKLTFDLT
jgi:tRNA pseudouridine38-40 synthase